MKDKIAMAQWVNRLWNNIFVNPPPLPLLCEISRALHLAQSGLTADRQTDEIQVNFEIFKISCRSKYSTCCLGTASLQPYQCIQAGFLDKTYCKVDC